ncbi:MAG: ubiquinol-cytochrome c reductase cytochrome b subunit [Acidimicrobiales bacterium]|jgi:ubiquinol-cytochrome c reductase cytochrome b subunit
MIDALFNWFDERLGISGSGRKMLNKIFPDHWSFLIGEIALYSFIVLLGTGVFLTLYFVPSSKDVIYQGSYAPLRGQPVSEAFASTLNLSFAVRGGLLMRQMHHWAANIFVGSIVVHMLRIFFTGAFRKPRELNWIVGSTLLILAIFNGFLGYSLPDDLVSGTGLRISFSIVESIPLIGSYAAFFLFGGNFPGNAIIPRFFILHVLILPAVIVGLLSAHLGMLVRQKHTQFPGRGNTPRNVVGAPLWPTFVAKTTGFMCLTVAVTGVLSAFFQINPVWLYGPYVPYKVSYAVQPDWYMGWLDGALRIMPSWEIVGFGHMIPNVFFPAILLPGITFGVLQMWPFIEARLTHDHAEHQILDRPRDRPKRTAFGAAVFSFYFVLFGASATDVLANYLSISLNVVLTSFRFLAVIVPLVVFPVTFRICKEMQSVPTAGKRKRANVVLRSAEGGYSTVPSEERPGDTVPRVDPLPLDEDFQFVTVLAGAVAAGDGQAGNGHVEDSEPVPPDEVHDGRRRGGIFKIPRAYR